MVRSDNGIAPTFPILKKVGHAGIRQPRNPYPNDPGPFGIGERPANNTGGGATPKAPAKSVP